MSLAPQPDGIGGVPHVSGKLLGYVALFLRLSLGLSLLNAGLAGVLSSGGPGGGMPGFGGRNVNPFTGTMGPIMPGMEGLAAVLPFAELAAGVGLVFGIFTTICALAGCALTLVTPLMVSLALVTTSGIGPTPNRFGMGFGFELLSLLPGQSALTYAVLVLLSPSTINRLSIDALIFRRASARSFPVPPGPAVPAPGPTELTAADVVDPA